MILWGAIQQAQREGRQIHLQSSRECGFPSRDFVDTTDEFQIACMGLIGFGSPLPPYWHSMMNRSPSLHDFISRLEEFLYWLYYDSWQHSHITQLPCRQWYHAISQWRTVQNRQLSLTHLLNDCRNLLRTPFEWKERITYRPIDPTGSLGRHYVLGKNTCLGRRILSISDAGEVSMIFSSFEDYQKQQPNIQALQKRWPLCFRITIRFETSQYSHLNAQLSKCWLGRGKEWRHNEHARHLR